MTIEDQKKVLSNWIEENLGFLNTSADEIACVMLDKLLEEHSCCDAQTWIFKDRKLYRKMIKAKSHIHPDPLGFLYDN